MNDYLFIMHDDALTDGDRSQAWSAYLAKLREAGVFQGGSTIGGGVCVAKSKAPPGITPHLSGYIRIRAADLKQARDFLAGNPIFEAGGTVEIRELPRD